MNNINKINQMNNIPQINNWKIKVAFKIINGSIKIDTISLDKTAKELIFLKKIGSEDLIRNIKDICFLNNILKSNLMIKEKYEIYLI
jgi:hypothetical protein